jgi:ABC-type glycerol-3-phosphate transport system permease component
MSIIALVGRKTFKMRLVIAIMYVVLAILGIGMVYPFLITLTSSLSNRLDYSRFSPVPRWIWSREDRFVRFLPRYFPTELRVGMDQFSVLFPNAPATWINWQEAGKDNKGIKTFADEYLSISKNSEKWYKAKLVAADYNDFASKYPIEWSLCAFEQTDTLSFFIRKYETLADQESSGGMSRIARRDKALSLLADHWQIPLESFYEIWPQRENAESWDRRFFYPQTDGRAQDFVELKTAYRDRWFVPGSIKSRIDKHGVGSVYPASEVRPIPLRMVWLSFLKQDSTVVALGLPKGTVIDIKLFNSVFGTNYKALNRTPFPVGPSEPAKLRKAWEMFVQERYPIRLIEPNVTPALSQQYRKFAFDRFKGSINLCNTMLGSQFKSWDELKLSKQMPTDSEPVAKLWMGFVQQLPMELKTPRSAEADYHKFLLEKYGSLEKINSAYGWNVQNLATVEMPFDIAYTVTFINNELGLSTYALVQNYRIVMDFLLGSKAIPNTIALVLLTLIAALTVNPLAAYALSRFQLKQNQSIILYLLATMAFPAAVSMIPGYLLMRDLGMLNTYAALVLPGIANGMSIFLLKGFFDSLPPELYEAAAIDGAPEMTVFIKITLPLVKPILAVMALNTFMATYSSWEWALLVCQKKDLWTLSVWLYQFGTMPATQPWVAMASYVVASIPVLLVFLLCQNIILRGIILPQMK